MSPPTSNRGKDGNPNGHHNTELRTETQNNMKIW